MLRLFTTLIASFTLAIALLIGVAFAEPATLRANIEARGAAITLGDVFENAGAQSGRAVALSPAPGATADIPVRVVANAAASAGLDWTPPGDLQTIRVTRSNLPAAPSVSRAQARADEAGGDGGESNSPSRTLRRRPLRACPMICRRPPGRASALCRTVQSRVPRSGLTPDYASLVRIAAPLDDASTTREAEAASTLTLPPKRRERESTGGCQVLLFAA